MSRLATGTLGSPVVVSRGLPSWGPPWLSPVPRSSFSSCSFHLCATKGNVGCLEVMLAHGADALTTDGSGHTALHLSAKHGHPQCVSKLLQSSCPVDVADSQGRTAIHHAAIHGSISCLEILCDFKASLNTKDQDGATPLMLAARMNHSELCHYLLHRGAAVNARDQKGRTALMVACENGSVETVEALIHGGARVGLIDATGRDAAHYGAAMGNALIQHYLQEAAQRHSWASEEESGNLSSQSLCKEKSNSPRKRKAPPPPPPPSGNPSQEDRDAYEEIAKLRQERAHFLQKIRGLEQLQDKQKQELETPNGSLSLLEKQLDDLQRRLAETANEKESLRKELEVLRSRLSLCENDKENTSYDVETLQDEEGEMLELPAAAELLSKKSLSASTEELLATLQSQIESLTRKNKKLMEKIEVLEKDESEADPSGDVIPVVLYDSLRSEFEKLKAQQLEAQELLKSLESQGTEESPPKPISAEAYEQRLKDDYEKQIAALKQALEKINCPGDPIGLNQATESEADVEPEGQSNFKRWGREETEELTKKLRETQEKYQVALAEVKLLEDQIELGILSVEDKEAAESSSIELQTVKAALHQTREELKERDQKVKDLEGLLRVREERGAQNCSAQACEEMKATLGASLDAVSKEKEALLQRCASVETELRELRASLQEKEKEEEEEKEEKKNSHQMLEGRSSISQALQETSKLREQLEAMTERHQEAKAHLEELREGREKLEEELQATKEILASEYVPRAEHEDTVEKLKAAFSEAEERLLEMKEKYTSTRIELAELQKSTEVYRRQSIPLTEHVRAKEALEGTLWELKAKAKLVEQELRAKAREASRLQADLDELRRGAVSKEAHEQLRAASQAESEALRAKLSDLGRKHERTCTEVFQVQREALFMKSEKQAAEAQLASAEKQLQSLRAESDRLQELHSHVEDSAELLKEKDKKITELSKEVLKLKEAPKDLSELSSSASSKGIFSPKADSDLDVATFQSRIKDLEQQLVESERRHSNIVSLYRGHLLYAIQGNMDEDVQKILFQILKMQRLQEQGR
ncbi:ankyrin repeat domain-containing protein 24 isoform X2 [Crotalus tigris]|uniref:ankyrin repeat domain-containing protein 24 isoform X2 n=1 Tax=Crotalus tigris TaxID=88082 RepID=UPI00192F4F10|nr:ankyrin repeat domain-containing protein 24 isoform X2 [Crotalus tigris]